MLSLNYKVWRGLPKADSFTGRQKTTRIKQERFTLNSMFHLRLKAFNTMLIRDKNF
jgi:hypothetical protein